MGWAIPKTVADNVGVHVQTVYFWVKEERIEFKRIAGSRVLIRVDSDGHPVGPRSKPDSA